mmetsp:Transcript_4340/g.10365  ORF Transcript_4340/g.10365 Transcript_4340/m.10365 type:complete len:235 (-) Transcript_4340:2810-3514(-)
MNVAVKVDRQTPSKRVSDGITGFFRKGVKLRVGLHCHRIELGTLFFLPVGVKLDAPQPIDHQMTIIVATKMISDHVVDSPGHVLGIFVVQIDGSTVGGVDRLVDARTILVPIARVCVGIVAPVLAIDNGIWKDIPIVARQEEAGSSAGNVFGVGGKSHGSLQNRKGFGNLVFLASGVGTGGHKSIPVHHPFFQSRKRSRSGIPRSVPKIIRVLKGDGRFSVDQTLRQGRVAGLV